MTERVRAVGAVIPAAGAGRRLGGVAKALLPTDGTTFLGAIAATLNRVWFASLVGWAGGLHSAREISECMQETAELLLGGSRATRPGGRDT